MEYGHERDDSCYNEILITSKLFHREISEKKMFPCCLILVITLN